jgi:DNA-binding response OmpR family regulator
MRPPGLQFGPQGGLAVSRILIVEDDSDLVALARRWLEREGHEVAHAPSGPAAIQALAAAHALPDLVLLDIMLPKIDGFEILRLIRNEERTKGLPVVMVTSFSRDKDVARGKALGATDYIVKPLMEIDFLDRVKAALKKS